MGKAFYKIAGEPDLLLDVLAENKDGTVELGTKKSDTQEKDELIIGKCKTAENGRPGSCVLADEADLSNEERIAKADKRAGKGKATPAPSPAPSKTPSPNPTLHPK